MTNQNKLTQDEIFERKLFIKVAAHKNTHDAEYAVKMYRKLFGVDDQTADTDDTQHELPWDTAPKWAQWAAMDGDSDWWWYDHRPKLDSHSWLTNMAPNTKEAFLHAPQFFHAPPFPGDWKDSLQRRPKK